MSGALRVRSLNLADSEARPVFGPAGNKVQRLGSARKPMMKTLRNEENSPEEVVALAEESNGLPSSAVALPLTPLFRRHLVDKSIYCILIYHSMLRVRLMHLRIHFIVVHQLVGYIGEIVCPSVGSNWPLSQKLVYLMPFQRLYLAAYNPRKGCPWFYSHSSWLMVGNDPRYAAFHDEEWGLTVHDDKKLFELLIFSGALAELTWPAILNRRHIFREVFADFDPISVPKHSVSEKKIAAPGSTASSLLLELKLRAIVDNARQISKVTLKGQIIKTYLLMLVHLHPPTMYFMGILSVPWMLLQQLKMAYNFGDQIVKFGNVEPDDDLLPKLASEALSNQDCEIPVVVLRQGALINLTVTPRAWQGRGLLGNVISESYDRLHGALMNSDASVRPARRQCPSRCVLNILSPLCQSIGVKGWLLSFKLLNIFGFCM
ncbi:unnamed protein product [Camellia sinensis]